MSDLTELDERISNLIASQEDVERVLYESPEEEERQQAAMANIEEGYKALSRRISSSEKNRWGYSPAGWLSKKLISKHLNSMKNGLFSVFVDEGFVTDTLEVLFELGVGVTFGVFALRGITSFIPA